MAGYIFSAELVDQFRRNPMHEALRDLGSAARDVNLLGTPEFRKLLGYLTEHADGRDRREPAVDVPGSPRPQPRLRALINNAFGEYGDLTWFRLNKIANTSHLPLKGMFSRMAASIGRISCENIEYLVAALVSDAPDRKLLRLLNREGGRIRNAGLECFTRLTYLFRPDLYFVIPRSWGEQSGCLKFIGHDMRKYCALCRTLRNICDDVGFPSEVRATLFDQAVRMTPMHPKLEAAVNASIGGALAWANVLEPGEGYAPGQDREEIAMPLEVAATAIRVRRGDTHLRSQLRRFYHNRCAISGDCPADLLEVAYIAPYPAGDVHSPRNAILLRSDLHTLWDLNLIAADPDSLEVAIGDRLTGTYYETFAGRTFFPRADAARMDKAALRERWNVFLAAQKKTTGDAAAGRKETPTEVKPEPKPTPVARQKVAIDVVNELEPQRSNASGIWRSPKATGATTAAAPVIEVVDE